MRLQAGTLRIGVVLIVAGARWVQAQTGAAVEGRTVISATEFLGRPTSTETDGSGRPTVLRYETPHGVLQLYVETGTVSFFRAPSLHVINTGANTKALVALAHRKAASG